MNKDDYVSSVDQLQFSQNFNERTAKLMKVALKDKKKHTAPKKYAFAFAGAAVIVASSVFALKFDTMFLSDKGSITNEVNDTHDLSNPGITVAQIDLSSAAGTKSTRMRPLFVYQGRVYLHYNTTVSTIDGYSVNEEDMLNLRGDYLGKTTGSIDEWSSQEDYATEFASTIGESSIYTVKGYDSSFRLMVYTEYPEGFSCEIFDSFGGVTLKEGADFFNLLQLKDNIQSYQWENYDSWNNGKGVRTDAVVDEVFDNFIEKLYTSVPVDKSLDMLIENTEADSQKFIYVKTKDNMITSIRLLKDGYVYAPEVGFFEVDQEAFQAFWNSMN